MRESTYNVNVERSKDVRNKLMVVSKELGIPYKLISAKAGFTRPGLSNFVTNKKNFNNDSLDRLEPVVDAYLKLLENSDAILRGVNNEG